MQNWSLSSGYSGLKIFFPGNIRRKTVQEFESADSDQKEREFWEQFNKKITDIENNVVVAYKRYSKCISVLKNESLNCVF